MQYKPKVVYMFPPYAIALFNANSHGIFPRTSFKLLSLALNFFKEPSCWQSQDLLAGSKKEY